MLNLNALPKDSMTILRIVERTAKLVRDPIDRLALDMDITAAHLNGCPLKLAELLEARDSDFLHDIAGIARHLDRKTGKLTDCFVPRYAVHQ